MPSPQVWMVSKISVAGVPGYANAPPIPASIAPRATASSPNSSSDSKHASENPPLGPALDTALLVGYSPEGGRRPVLGSTDNQLTTCANGGGWPEFHEIENETH